MSDPSVVMHLSPGFIQHIAHVTPRLRSCAHRWEHNQHRAAASVCLRLLDRARGVTGNLVEGLADPLDVVGDLLRVVSVGGIVRLEGEHLEEAGRLETTGPRNTEVSSPVLHAHRDSSIAECLSEISVPVSYTHLRAH